MNRLAASGLAALLLALPALPASAQGIVRGAQEGATVGNKAAGPVGGAVGGVVGGVAGGVAGGVKGVLGIPQNSSARRHARKRGNATLAPAALRAALVGRPLAWTSPDGTQTATATYNADGTAALSNATLASGADDTGHWELKGRQQCTTWDKWNPGQESCSSWTKTGAKTYRSADGATVTLP